MIKITTICLVRHGETNWNALGKLQGRTDIPLNKRGVFQAEECGQFLRNEKWDVTITSPLLRAKQTAHIINNHIKVPIIEMPEFQERGYGDAEGLTPKERLTLFPDGVYPNQEDRLSLTKRVVEGLKEINIRFHDKKVLLVAHGAVINAILYELSDGEVGSGKTSLINACISNIEFRQQAWAIINFNQVNHLSSYG